MSMNPLTPDDPRLTAYVLGELHGAERADIERQLADSPALQAAADGLRETTALLGAAFDAEPTPSLSAAERHAITAAALGPHAPMPAGPTARPVATDTQNMPRHGAPAVMAVAAIALLAGVVLTLHDTADQDERTTVTMTEAEEYDEHAPADATEWAEHSARGVVALDPNAVMDESGIVRQRGREAGGRAGGQAGNKDFLAARDPQSSAPASGDGQAPENNGIVVLSDGLGRALDGKTMPNRLSLDVKQTQRLQEGRKTVNSHAVVQLGVLPNISRPSISGLGVQPGRTAEGAFYYPYRDTNVPNLDSYERLGDLQGQAGWSYGVKVANGSIGGMGGIGGGGGIPGGMPKGWGTAQLEWSDGRWKKNANGDGALAGEGLFEQFGVEGEKLGQLGKKLAPDNPVGPLAGVEQVVEQLAEGKKLNLQDAEKLKRELLVVEQQQAEQVQQLQQQLARLRAATEPPQGEQYLPIVENEFIEPVGQAALSTFSIDVDTASYTNVRRFLHQGQLPPPSAVRIEELLNYFRYDYPQPPDGQPFSVNTEVAPCPWNPKHRLLRFGIKAREISADQRPKSNLVFLVDTSGSMSSGDKLPLVQQGLELLAGEMGEGDRVAIVTYAGTVGTALESTPGTDRQRIVEVIRGLASGGSTNGAGGITAAYDLAVSHFIEDGTNRVILCTDGDFNVGVSSQQGLEALIEEKRQSGVFLSVFGFGTGNIQDGKMEQLANKGNGVYAYVDSLREAKRVFVKEMTGTLYTIAKDVKLQVEFNPNKVGAYRLIGYENRVLAAQDFHDDKKDAGEIGAGHTVTALYEIIPVGLVPQDQPKVDDLKYQSNPKPLPPEASDELCTLKLRHKKPDADKSTLFRFPVKDLGEDADIEPSPELEWQAAVAGFGMILRESKYRGHASYPLVKELALGGIGEDERGDRREFIDLVMRAEEIARQRAGQAPPPPMQLDEQTAREKATLGGTYANLLMTVHAPNDFAAYGNFHEWGHWSGSEWAGHENLPAGHWVYVYPNWYIWGEKGQPAPAQAEKPAH